MMRYEQECKAFMASLLKQLKTAIEREIKPCMPKKRERIFKYTLEDHFVKPLLVISVIESKLGWSRFYTLQQLCNWHAVMTTPIGETADIITEVHEEIFDNTENITGRGFCDDTDFYLVLADLDDHRNDAKNVAAELLRLCKNASFNNIENPQISQPAY